MLHALIITSLLVASPKTEAKRLLKEADRAFDAGRYPEAAQQYLDSYAKVPKPGMLYNAGLAYERMGQCVKVVELFSRFLKEKPNHTIGDLLDRIDKAKSCAPEVIIQTQPPGGSVEVDGITLGTAPVTTRLETGGHTMTITKEGYRMLEQAFAVQPGKPQALTLPLVPLVGQGTVSVQITTEAKVFLDGELVAKGPYRGIRKVSAGPHELRIEEENCKPRTITIDVDEGDTPLLVDPKGICIPLDGDLTSRGGELTVDTTIGRDSIDGKVWAGVAVGVVGIAAGVGLTVASNDFASKRDLHIAAGNEGAEAASDNDRAFGTSIGAGVGYALGAVGIALLIWGLVDGEEAPSVAVRW